MARFKVLRAEQLKNFGRETSRPSLGGRRKQAGESQKMGSEPALTKDKEYKSLTPPG